MTESGESGGLFAALKNIAATLLASGKTRLELLSNELEGEKLRAIQLVLLSQAMAFCIGVGTLLVIALLTVIFWDDKLMVLGVFAGVFFVLGGVFYSLVKRATQRPERVFAASIAELQEDLRQLKVAAGYEPPAK